MVYERPTETRPLDLDRVLDGVWDDYDGTITSRGVDVLRVILYRLILSDRGITQSDVAEELGISKQAVGQYLTGMRPKNLDRIDAAITAITERRGGLEAVAPSAPGLRASDHISRDLMRAPKDGARTLKAMPEPLYEAGPYLRDGILRISEDNF